MNNLDFNAFLLIVRKYYSGDNCQPLQFSFQDNKIQIHYRADIAKHTLVYDYQTLAITLGGAIEYARNALIAQKITNVHIHFDTNLASIDVNKNADSICTMSEGDRTLELEPIAIDVLQARTTDRRGYLAHSANDISVERFNSQLRRVNCRVLTQIPADTLKFFAWSDSQVWLSKPLGLDILNSVDFESDCPEVGLPKKNLGVSAVELMPIRLVQKYPKLFNVFAAMGFQKGMQGSQLKLWKSSQSAILFTLNKKQTVEEKTLASAEMMHVILQLTAAGFSVQPSTLSTEILNIPIKQNDENLSTATSIDFTPEFKRISDIRKQLQVNDEQQVLWLLRIGKPSCAFPDNAKTGRRNIQSITR